MGRFEHLEMDDGSPKRRVNNPEQSDAIDHKYYLEKAEEAFYEESYERALAFYSRALGYDDKLEQGWLGQIRCLIEQGNLTDALTWSGRSLEKLPNAPELLAARSIIESRRGRYAQAIGYSDASMNTPIVTPYLWVARGEALLTKNAANAGECFARAIHASPDDWRVPIWVAHAYLVRDSYHQALEHLRQAVRMNQNLCMCWYWIGKCCESLGDDQEAKISYGRALAVQPNLVQARNAICMLEGQGAAAKVGSAFKRLLKG